MNTKRIVKEKRKPKVKPASDWCDHTGKVKATNTGKRPSHVRCPKCGKRLIPKTITTGGLGEPFEPAYLIPQHKLPSSKR